MNSDSQYPNGWDKLMQVTEDHRLIVSRTAEVFMIGRPDRKEFNEGGSN